MHECYDSMMQTAQIVALLISERDRLDAAIRALQGSERRRGRPPVNTSSASAAVSKEARPKRTLSAAGRKAIAEAARKRWAAIRAGKAQAPFAKGKAKKS